MVNNLHNILNHRASKYVKLARMWDNTRNFSSKSVCVVHNRSSANWAKCHSFLAILAENMSCTTARHRKATWDFETNRTLYQSSNLVFKSAHSDLYLYALPFESLVWSKYENKCWNKVSKELINMYCFRIEQDIKTLNHISMPKYSSSVIKLSNSSCESSITLCDLLSSVGAILLLSLFTWQQIKCLSITFCWLSCCKIVWNSSSLKSSQINLSSGKAILSKRFYWYIREWKLTYCCV